jgi:hypothetical protein
MYVLSEAHVLAEVSDLPAATLHALVEANFGAYAAGVSTRITSGSYVAPAGERPSSGLDLGIKDVGIGVGIAKERGVRLRVGELCLEGMEGARGWGEKEGKAERLDSSSVFGSVRVGAGLGFESEVVRERDGRMTGRRATRRPRNPAPQPPRTRQTKPNRGPTSPSSAPWYTRAAVWPW